MDKKPEVDIVKSFQEGVVKGFLDSRKLKAVEKAINVDAKPGEWVYRSGPESGLKVNADDTVSFIRPKPVDCLSRTEINWQSEPTREDELERELSILKEILASETKRADDAESSVDLLKQDVARLTRLARYQASRLPLKRTEQCVSCEKEFEPEGHNEHSSGDWFCDDCLSNPEEH